MKIWAKINLGLAVLTLMSLITTIGFLVINYSDSIIAYIYLYTLAFFMPTIIRTIKTPPDPSDDETINDLIHGAISLFILGALQLLNWSGSKDTFTALYGIILFSSLVISVSKKGRFRERGN